jgi:hypothetical protein
LKGSRDAYKINFVETSRTFLYLPSKSRQLELDLTLTLLAQALRRNLFPGGIDYVLNTQDMWLKTDPDVANQAVFVASHQNGGILPEQPMKSSALNPRLRRALIDAGLPQRNTMYCFRRERIIHTKHMYGTEAAKTIAVHKENTDTHNVYDVVNVGDIDIQGQLA